MCCIFGTGAASFSPERVPCDGTASGDPHLSAGWVDLLRIWREQMATINRSAEVGSQPLDTSSSRAAQKLQEQSIGLYQLYGKPLEQAHWGEYLAISPEGKTLLGSALLDVME